MNFLKIFINIKYYILTFFKYSIIIEFSYFIILITIKNKLLIMKW